MGFYSKVVTNKSADFNGIYMDKDGIFKKMPDTYERTLWHDPEITPDSGCRDYWYAENGLPPIELNNLFKYAVPVVHNKLGDEPYYDLMIMWIRDTIFGKVPSISLFWALYPVITGKEVGE